MDTATPAGPDYVVPNPRIPKVLGILNIVFGSAMLLCGLCMSVYLVMLPAFAKGMNQIQQKVVDEGEKKRQVELKIVADEEKAATTDAEKAEIKSRRQAIEARPKVAMPGMMDFDKMGMNDPKIIGWSWVELVTGLILNILLLASGIGLVGYKPWSVSLGIWTALGKIARLLLLYSYFALAIVPSFSRNMGAAMTEMMVQQQQAAGRPMPAAMNADFLVKTYTVTYTAYSIGLIVIGSIYPAVSIWLLSRRSVRAACSGSPSMKERQDTW